MQTAQDPPRAPAPEEALPATEPPAPAGAPAPREMEEPVTESAMTAPAEAVLPEGGSAAEAGNFSGEAGALAEGTPADAPAPIGSGETTAQNGAREGEAGAPAPCEMIEEPACAPEGSAAAQQPPEDTENSPAGESISTDGAQSLPAQSASAPETDAQISPPGEISAIEVEKPNETANPDETNKPSEADEENAPEEEFAEVVAVRFRASGRSKAYHFDPAGERFAVGDRVIVATSRGDEFGEVTTANTRLRTSALVLPLKRVLRRATKEDEERYERVLSREGEVLRESAPLFERHDPPMKLVDVEYTFDSSKLFFYFMADGRVDFRELVRQLGGKYHCRIELRQVGERDRAKEMGGIGMCGRPLCCHTFLHDFTQVSIKIAKEQSLALATSKISGACGKLMCCLRFEYDTYVEENKRTPRVGSVVHTRDGNGTVIEARPLVGMVKVRPLDAPDADARVYPREEVFPGLGEFPPQATKPSQATRPPQPSSPSRRAPRGEGSDRLPAARAAGSESEPNRLSPDGDEGENLAASRGGPEEVASLATGRGSRGRGSVHRAPRRPSQGAVDEGAAPAPSESKRLSRVRRGARQPGAQITPDKIEQSEPRSARGAGGAQGEGIKPSREGGRPSETKRAAGRARANRPAAGGASGISRAAGERAGKGYTVSRAGGADDNRASAGERSSGKGYTVLQKGGKPPREGE